jgi:hypothetical protein
MRRIIGCLVESNHHLCREPKLKTPFWLVRPLVILQENAWLSLRLNREAKNWDRVTFRLRETARRSRNVIVLCSISTKHPEHVCLHKYYDVQRRLMAGRGRRAATASASAERR